MGALPKRKISKGRRNRRRSHDSLTVTRLIACDNCGEMKLPHIIIGKINGIRLRNAV